MENIKNEIDNKKRKLLIEIFWKEGDIDKVSKSKEIIWKWLQKFSNHLGITSMSRKENYE
jgi:hypothetical protein